MLEFFLFLVLVLSIVALNCICVMYAITGKIIQSNRQYIKILLISILSIVFIWRCIPNASHTGTQNVNLYNIYNGSEIIYDTQYNVLFYRNENNNIVSYPNFNISSIKKDISDGDYAYFEVIEKYTSYNQLVYMSYSNFHTIEVILHISDATNITYQYENR